MSFLGDTVEIRNGTNLVPDIGEVVIGPGIEGSFDIFPFQEPGEPNATYFVDLDDNSVTLTFNNGFNFPNTATAANGIRVIGLDSSTGLLIEDVVLTQGTPERTPFINVFQDRRGFSLIVDPLNEAPSTQIFKFDIVLECFLTGTNILTGHGYKKVEELKIGDLVKTADGKLEAVKWIGKQTVNPSQIKNPLRSHPILIKAGALGNGLPVRDLYTSPDHAYLVDGLLINAGALVNDISIVKTEPTETFTYYHVELENHALLLAEGASAESYLPQKENRDEYNNAAEYYEHYPHGSNLMLFPMDYPRVSSHYKVPSYVRQKLMQIAEELYVEKVA